MPSDQANNNQVDGIKKIDKKEIEKSRKLVLGAIQDEIETVRHEQEKKKPKRSLSVDSIIKPKQKNSIAPELLKAEEIGPEKLDNKREEAKMAASKKAQIEEDRLEEERIEAQKELLERRKQLEDKQKALKLQKEERRKQHKIELQKTQDTEQNRKQAEQESKMRSEEKKRSEQIKERQNKEAIIARQKAVEAKEATRKANVIELKRRKADDDLKKREAELRRKEEAKKEKKRKENDKLRKKKDKAKRKAKKKDNIRQIKILLKNKSSYYLKRIFNYLIFSLVICIFVYLLFALIVLKTNTDNHKIISLTKAIKIPAVITGLGIVDYNEFKTIEKNTLNNCSEKEVCRSMLRNNIAEFLIIGHLIQKYSLSTSYSEAEDKLSEYIFNDKEINQVAINRIQKIDEMINQGGNFVEIANKYADKQDKIDFSTEADASEVFGEEIVELEPGEISSIINSKDGYYIVRRYAKEGSELAFSYVYIKGKNLDEYLREEISNTRLWSIVEID